MRVLVALLFVPAVAAFATDEQQVLAVGILSGITFGLAVSGAIALLLASSR